MHTAGNVAYELADVIGRNGDIEFQRRAFEVDRLGMPLAVSPNRSRCHIVGCDRDVGDRELRNRGGERVGRIGVRGRLDEHERFVRGRERVRQRETRAMSGKSD